MGTSQSSSSFKRPRGSQRFTDAGEESTTILSSLAPPSSVTTLNKAVEPISHLIEDLSDRVKYSLEQCKNPQDGLSNDESAALFLYTQQWPYGTTSLYTMLNRAELVPFRQYLSLLLSALRKLPSIESHIWRATVGDYNAQYQLDTVHVWWGVSSCSDLVQVMNDFLDQTKVLTLFNIQCINGKVIKNHSEFPDEDEVILLPGTYLKVAASIKATDNLCIIYLEEIIPTVEEIARCTKVANDVTKETTYILWLDSSVKSEENEEVHKKLIELFQNNFLAYERAEEMMDYIEKNPDKHFLLIASGQMGREVVPKIQPRSQFHSIIIYCMNKQANEKWSKKYEKIKAVVITSDDLIDQVQQLYKDLTGQEISLKTEPNKST